MSQDHVSFVLWLFSTLIMRDVIRGGGLSEEAIWSYKLSLQVMREASKRHVNEYTDSFFNSMACFAAASVSALSLGFSLLQSGSWTSW